MFNFSKQYLMAELVPWVRRVWQEAGEQRPDYLPVYETAVQAANEGRVASYKERLERQLNGFSYPALSALLPGKRKRWREQTEKLLDEVLWTEPLLQLDQVLSQERLEDFKKQAKAFVARVRRFDQELDLEGMGQALRNYIVYAVFLELHHLPQRCSGAIFGYSMLYPYTDNYIDDPARTAAEKQHYNQLIGAVIRNQPYEAHNLHEQQTVRLLEAVREDYGETDVIFEGLGNMLDAQQISLTQTDQETALDRREILDISIYKGGISVLIDRYFINEPPKEQDHYFYFAFGFLLQLCDDLQDIAQDRQNGSRTLFTTCETEQEFEAGVNKLLHYTKNLFEGYQSKNERFKQFLLHNTYLLILHSAAGSKEFFAAEWLGWVAERLPVREGFMAEMQRSFYEMEQRAESQTAEGAVPGAVKMAGGPPVNQKLLRLLDEFLVSE